ncbi:hypothetical protein BKA62DRAFT_720341 [Auriculariales sp. MPI-PUGE-AT-0066]|nr:hypothetical protein BKA62DRAFT_720341 [Auriculariales sp. MPI-PUGE-AT-0066]
MQTPQTLSANGATTSIRVGSWVKYTSVMYYKSDSKASLEMDMGAEGSRKLWGLVVDRNRFDNEEVTVLQLVTVASDEIDTERLFHVNAIKTPTGAECQTQGTSSPRALCLVLQDMTIRTRQIIGSFFEEWQGQIDVLTVRIALGLYQNMSYSWSTKGGTRCVRHGSCRLRRLTIRRQARQLVLAHQYILKRRGQVQSEMSRRMFMAVLRELKAQTPEA